MTPVLVYVPTDGPMAFSAALQLARAILAGESANTATLTEGQARHFGSGAKVRAAMELWESESVWRDECLLRHDAELGVVFYAKSQGKVSESTSETKTGVWMCGWVQDAEE